MRPVDASTMSGDGFGGTRAALNRFIAAGAGTGIAGFTWRVLALEIDVWYVIMGLHTVQGVAGR